ncbi:MAG: MFS transporter [Bryobacteraceae bacterium]|nr:MFS transporter [Bryobacteraceae bacterium]
MTSHERATAIRLPDFRTPPMRAFHMAWFAFFLCFFGWFGIAPLMPVIRQELNLTKEQIGNTIIASVAITVIARLLIGWLCDRFGPRRTYAALLVLGALPVMGVGLAHDYTSFLLFRLAIGAIGASFVITQFHTSVMFAPSIVGTANATAAGWGNLGGGVTQIVMPMLFAVFIGAGAGAWWSWRLAMVIPGVAMLLTGIAYYYLTQDTPSGEWNRGERRPNASAAFREACGDGRVWALAALYAACFGMELTIDNIAALYFVDTFHLSMGAAGIVAGTFGMMNLFARALGGIVSDWAHRRWGLNGRTALLAVTIALEGVALVCFALAGWLPLAIGCMLVTGLFIKMSNGATYAVVPFVNKRALGAVAGIVGAGGNVGAVLAGFLFKTNSLSYSQALLILGVVVTASATLAVAVRFTAEAREQTRMPLGEAVHSAAGGD